MRAAAAAGGAADVGDVPPGGAGADPDAAVAAGHAAGDAGPVRLPVPVVAGALCAEVRGDAGGAAGGRAAPVEPGDRAPAAAPLLPPTQGLLPLRLLLQGKYCVLVRLNHSRSKSKD